MVAKINRSTTVHQGRVFSLIRESITLENGFCTDVEFVQHPGATAIVAMQGPGQVILLSQYRHSLRRYIWEIPAGTLDPQESVSACAKRELIEETGYAADEWQKLGEITPAPGYSDERIHIFLASRLRPAERNLDQDELIQVHSVDWAKAMEMITLGEIQDGKSISALFLAVNWLKNHRFARNKRGDRRD
jgi:ADP-ribose pyrophosphatase